MQQQEVMYRQTLLATKHHAPRGLTSMDYIIRAHRKCISFISWSFHPWGNSSLQPLNRRRSAPQCWSRQCGIQKALSLLPETKPLLLGYQGRRLVAILTRLSGLTKQASDPCKYKG